MSTRAFIAAGFLGLSLPVLAQSGVYKCSTEDAETIYRDTPCEAGQAQRALLEIPPRVPAQVQELTGGRTDPTPPAKSESTSPGGAPLTPGLLNGMSDTRVLNHRSWGQPQKITRARVQEGWQELWTYTARVHGPISLLFVNGRLAGVTSESVTQGLPAVTQPTDNVTVGNLELL